MSRSPFGPLAVIADPRAGGGRVADELPAVEKAIVERGIEYRWQVSDTPADTTRWTADALDHGYRYLAAVGDDATVQDVVNGMFRDGHPIVPDAVLAVIPANSACDLIKSFGLPGDAVDATAHLVGEETYPLDLMKIQSLSETREPTVRYAHNMVQIGFHADATARTARHPERLGNARRFLGFWGAYVRARPVDLAIDVDGRAHALRGWSLVIGNGQFADGGMRLSPRSFPGDGVMDALVFTGPKSDAYRMLPRIFRHGDHIPDPGIKELRSKLVLRVDTGRRLPVVADGCYVGTTPVSIQMVPRQILLKL